MSRRAGVHAAHSVNQFVFSVPDLAEAARFYVAFGLDVRAHHEQLDLYTFGHPHRWATVVQAPGHDFINYVPTSRPGAIAPHAWLHDGSSLYDHFGKGFTLLANKDASQSLIDEAQQQTRAAGVPLKVVQPREAGLQSLYPTRLTLIRPDQHVAWRGNVLPEQSMGLFERVTGRVQVAVLAEVTA